eukprot:1159662-Pelagomonas_calceolata.AAC.10
MFLRLADFHTAGSFHARSMHVLMPSCRRDLRSWCTSKGVCARCPSSCLHSCTSSPSGYRACQQHGCVYHGAREQVRPCCWFRLTLTQELSPEIYGGLLSKDLPDRKPACMTACVLAWMVRLLPMMRACSAVQGKLERL